MAITITPSNLSTTPQCPPHIETWDGGIFYPPHTSLSHFDAIGLFRPLPNAPLASNRKTGAFLPTPQLPLTFRRDRVVSTASQPPLVSKREMGGFVPTPTPPSRILTRWGCLTAPLIPPRIETQDGGLFVPTPHHPLTLRHNGGFVIN